jgi:hypothetical protein
MWTEYQDDGSVLYTDTLEFVCPVCGKRYTSTSSASSYEGVFQIETNEHGDYVMECSFACWAKDEGVSEEELREKFKENRRLSIN